MVSRWSQHGGRRSEDSSFCTRRPINWISTDCASSADEHTRRLALPAFLWQNEHCYLVQVMGRRGRKREGEEEREKEKQRMQERGMAEVKK
jgi:hypothetical protein